MSALSAFVFLLVVVQPISAQWVCSDGQPSRGLCVRSSCAQTETVCENRLCCNARTDNYRVPGSIPAAQNTVRQQQPVYSYNSNTQQWQQQQQQVQPQQQQPWQARVQQQPQQPTYAQQVSYPQRSQSACAGTGQPLCACSSQASPSCPTAGYYCQRANAQELNQYQLTNQIQPDGVCCPYPGSAQVQGTGQYYPNQVQQQQYPNVNIQPRYVQQQTYPPVNVYPTAPNAYTGYANSYRSQIATQTAKHPVMMYTLSNCVYCKNAKTLLASLYADLKPMSVDVDKSPAMEAQMTTDLQQITGTNMFPMIFVCNNYIGGYDRLSILHRSGQFRAMARKCS